MGKPRNHGTADAQIIQFAGAERIQLRLRSCVAPMTLDSVRNPFLRAINGQSKTINAFTFSDMHHNRSPCVLAYPPSAYTTYLENCCGCTMEYAAMPLCATVMLQSGDWLGAHLFCLRCYARNTHMCDAGVFGAEAGSNRGQDAAHPCSLARKTYSGSLRLRARMARQPHASAAPRPIPAFAGCRPTLEDLLSRNSINRSGKGHALNVQTAAKFANYYDAVFCCGPTPGLARSVDGIGWNSFQLPRAMPEKESVGQHFTIYHRHFR